MSNICGPFFVNLEKSMNRKYSLRKNFEIEKLVKMKISVGNKFFAIYYRKNDDNNTKIAVSVSKKNGNAVERNYQKRVVKEIVRKNLDELSGYSMLIVVKSLSKDLTYSEKVEVLEKLFSKIRKEQRER